MKRARLVLVSLAVAMPAASQSQDMEAAGRLGQAAFECAALAASGGDEIHKLAAPLAQLGYDSYDGIMEQLSIQMRTGDLGPQGPFLSTVSPDFMIGVRYAQANKDVSDFIDTEAPITGGTSADGVMSLREFAATAEFDRRNCRLLG